MKWAIVAAAVLVAGCVQVGPKNLPVTSPCPKLAVPPPQQCPKITSQQCPRYALPAIADTVTIKIRGTVVEADAGGEQLIREYAHAQKLLQ